MTESTANVEFKFTKPSVVKKYALELAQMRGKKFSRVGKSFLQRVEAKTRNIIASEVHGHPSVGKTLQ
jgi:hypothetical protein